MYRLLPFTFSLSLIGTIIGCGQTDTTVSEPTELKTQEQSSADQFIGTYKLLKVERRVDNGEWEAVGPDRLAYLLYDSSGHMSVQLMPVDRKPYESEQPTAEEALASITSYGAYFGPYSVDESTQTVTHHREGHLNPGQANVDAPRGYAFSGELLTLTPPSRSVDGQEVTTHLIWERLPEVTLTPGQERFVGFWRLISNERHTVDGELISKVDGQTGYIMYTASQHMAVQMMRPNRQPYTKNIPTAEEAHTAITTYGNYFGTFSVNEEEGFVTHHREGNLNPNGVNTDAKRFRTFSGDRLILQPPARDIDGQEVQSTITWERITGPNQTP